MPSSSQLRNSLSRLTAQNRSALQFSLSRRQNHNRTFYYIDEKFAEHSYVHERNDSMKSRLQGLKEERAHCASDQGKFLDRIANYVADVFYAKFYTRADFAWPREFYGNPWCRVMSVDGIPGSGAKEFSRKLADERELRHSDRPDLYYFFKRMGYECEARKALSESHKNGGVGNYYEDWLNMDWSKVWENPSDWKMAAKCTAWQLRSFRLQEMDNMTNHLLGYHGIVANQTYRSYRAEIHAMGETGMFPDVLYQSFIDQYEAMDGRVTNLPICFYFDVEPEEAYDRIQKDESMSDAEKSFYTLDYLRAYKEGYEKFVLPQMEQSAHLIIYLRPEDTENMEFLCEQLVQKYPDMYAGHSDWDDRLLCKDFISAREKTNQTRPTNTYWQLVDDNLDIPDQVRHGWRNMNKHSMTQGMYPWTTQRRTIKGEQLIRWKYPIDVVDDGWHWYNMTDINPDSTEMNNIWMSEQMQLQKRGYGMRKGLNKGEELGNSLIKNLCHNNTEKYGNTAFKFHTPWYWVANS